MTMIFANAPLYKQCNYFALQQHWLFLCPPVSICLSSGLQLFVMWSFHLNFHRSSQSPPLSLSLDYPSHWVINNLITRTHSGRPQTMYELGDLGFDWSISTWFVVTRRASASYNRAHLWPTENFHWLRVLCPNEETTPNDVPLKIFSVHGLIPVNP